MQDLNNEMDDLFRKAVELYPLKPCDSRWDIVAAKIKSKKRWGFFLPLVFRQNKYRMSIFLSVTLLIPAIIISLAPLANKKSTSGELPKKITTANESAVSLHEKPNRGFTSVPFRMPPSIIDENIMASATVPLSFSNILLTEPSERNDKNSHVENPNDYDHRICEVYPVNPGKPLHFDRKPGWRNPVAKPMKLALQHLAMPSRQGFYFGVQGGPLFSQVRNQGITKPGFDFGILMGYTFSGKLSLETGVIRTRQYFTAGGDYLREILRIDGAQSLEGSRNAISIPLKLKYNIINGSSGNFFFTAGITSVVGVRDHILITLNYVPVRAADTISLGPSYMPSYLNFSLGYDYKIGKRSNIRIEPYVEIPMNNTAGNSFKTSTPDHFVHLFNSGIHITISQFIH